MEQPKTPDRHTVYEDATGENRNDPLPRVLLISIAVIIVSVMVGIPLLRVLAWDDSPEDSRTQAASEARWQVALLFSRAVLEERSNRFAALYVEPEIQESVQEVITDLRRREAAELQDAVANVNRVGCRDSVPDSECFLALLARPDEPSVSELRFTVAIVDGTARVVEIGDPLTALRR